MTASNYLYVIALGVAVIGWQARALADDDVTVVPAPAAKPAPNPQTVAMRYRQFRAVIATVIFLPCKSGFNHEGWGRLSITKHRRWLDTPAPLIIQIII